MTDPTGRSFLSYRRSRSGEIGRLVAALQERGIPTWRDTDDMNTEPTESELRRILRDDNTASAILWITPETADSAMIKNVEAPVALERHTRDDGFFIIPVAAGGLSYKQAGEAVTPGSNPNDLKYWHILKLNSDPASDEDIIKVANQALKQRLQAIDRQLLPEQPARIKLNTRETVGHQPGTALNIDWSRRFGGEYRREATADNWRETLLPALSDVYQAIQENIPARKLLASGLPSLPAATALGYRFMATTGVDIAWEQWMPDGSIQEWNLKTDSEDSGFVAVHQAGATDGTDLAVMVSVNNDVWPALAASQAATDSFRAYVQVSRADSAKGALLKSPGQAKEVAEKTIAAARAARREYNITGRVHLFIATPAGLAMLIGQQLNTLGPIQTYEHIPSNATGCYRPAALLNG